MIRAGMGFVCEGQTQHQHEAFGGLKTGAGKQLPNVERRVPLTLRASKSCLRNHSAPNQIREARFILVYMSKPLLVNFTTSR